MYVFWFTHAVCVCVQEPGTEIHGCCPTLIGVGWKFPWSGCVGQGIAAALLEQQQCFLASLCSLWDGHSNLLEGEHRGGHCQENRATRCPRHYQPPQPCHRRRLRTHRCHLPFVSKGVFWLSPFRQLLHLEWQKTFWTLTWCDTMTFCVLSKKGKKICFYVCQMHGSANLGPCHGGQGLIPYWLPFMKAQEKCCWIAPDKTISRQPVWQTLVGHLGFSLLKAKISDNSFLGKKNTCEETYKQERSLASQIY